MTRVASWEGAIVRGHGPRKGRVVADGLSRLTREHRLLIHWDDDTLEDLPADKVTMIAPPIRHAGELDEPEEEGTSAVLTRLWWPGVSLLLATLFACSLLVSWWTR